jgi:hypothetical protein
VVTVVQALRSRLRPVVQVVGTLTAPGRQEQRIKAAQVETVLQAQAFGVAVVVVVQVRSA